MKTVPNKIYRKSHVTDWQVYVHERYAAAKQLSKTITLIDSPTDGRHKPSSWKM